MPEYRAVHSSFLPDVSEKLDRGREYLQSASNGGDLLLHGDLFIASFASDDLRDAVVEVDEGIVVPLTRIETVSGDVIVGKMWRNEQYEGDENPGLKNLDGFALKALGGSLWIYGNSNLVDLVGLEKSPHSW